MLTPIPTPIRHESVSIQYWWPAAEPTTGSYNRWRSQYCFALRALAHAIPWSEPALRLEPALKVCTGTAPLPTAYGWEQMEAMSVEVPQGAAMDKVLTAWKGLAARRAGIRRLSIDAPMRERLCASAYVLPDCIVKLGFSGPANAAQWERSLRLPVACCADEAEAHELEAMELAERSPERRSARVRLLESIAARRTAIARA